MKKQSIRHHLSIEDKLIIIRQILEGKSVSQVSKQRKISRTIVYKWLKQSVNTSRAKLKTALSAKNPKGKKHWRHIDGVEEKVQDLVMQNCQDSIDKIHKSVRERGMLISRSGLYYVLKRLALNTYEDRLKYSISQIPVSRRYSRLPENDLPLALRYSFFSFFSPPAFNNVSLVIKFVFVALSSFVVSICILFFSFHFLNVYQEYPYASHNVTREQSRYPSQINMKRKMALTPKERLIYIVTAGDSLWHISEEIYGSGYNWPDIASANKLPNPDYIEIGQQLVIPVVQPKIVASGMR